MARPVEHLVVGMLHAVQIEVHPDLNLVRHLLYQSQLMDYAALGMMPGSAAQVKLVHLIAAGFLRPDPKLGSMCWA